jgi:hypothetical protein
MLTMKFETDDETEYWIAAPKEGGRGWIGRPGRGQFKPGLKQRAMIKHGLDGYCNVVPLEKGILPEGEVVTGVVEELHAGLLLRSGWPGSPRIGGPEKPPGGTERMTVTLPTVQVRHLEQLAKDADKSLSRYLSDTLPSPK